MKNEVFIFYERGISAIHCISRYAPVAVEAGDDVSGCVCVPPARVLFFLVLFTEKRFRNEPFFLRPDIGCAVVGDLDSVLVDGGERFERPDDSGAARYILGSVPGLFDNLELPAAGQGVIVFSVSRNHAQHFLGMRALRPMGPPLF